MSGFHYHEFQALNRLLDAAPQKVLGQISIRAGITVAGAWIFRASCEWKSVIGCSRFDDSKELATEDGYAIPLGEPFGQFRGLH